MTGVRIVGVEADSAAAEVGLRAGDLITAIDGQPVSSMAALQADLYLMPPSSSVKLMLVQGHERTEVRATLKPAA